jgi:primosomal replication protein N
LNRNQFVLDGEIVALDTLRHTPAGIPSFSLTLKHESKQEEAGSEADTRFEMNAVAFGEIANEMARSLKTGQQISVKGFMNRKNRFSEYPVLHITQFKLQD